MLSGTHTNTQFEKKTVDTMVGRAAHVALLESQALLHTLVLLYGHLLADTPSLV